MAKLWPATSLALALVANASDAQPAEFAPCSKQDLRNTIYGAECGNISLAENPLDAASRMIDVYLMRLPSIRATAKAPIFFIAGGPGQAASDLAFQFQHQFADLLVEHDFVFVDQRGTGKSNPLECDFNFLDYADRAPSAVEKINIEEQRQCLQGYSADLRFYTTPYAVKDLETVRRYLGYAQIYIWGGSYGSRVAIEYLRSYPQSLAGAILDGVAPVTMQIPRYAGRDASAALGKIFATCAGDDQCKLAFPNLKLRWLSLLREVKEKPQRIALKHPRTEQAITVYIDHLTLSSWVRLILYSRDLIPILPLAIQRAVESDYAKLFSMVALAFDNISQGISEGMQATVLCAEDRQLRLREAKPAAIFEQLVFTPPDDYMDETCALYPNGDLAPDYFKAISSTVPTLLLSGEFDPVTPPIWAESMVTQLSSHQHIVVPGGHHIVSSLGCVTDLIFAFVQTPQQVGSLDTECVNQIKPMHFFVDNAGPSLVSRGDVSEGEER